MAGKPGMLPVPSCCPESTRKLDGFLFGKLVRDCTVGRFLVYVFRVLEIWMRILQLSALKQHPDTVSKSTAA